MNNKKYGEYRCSKHGCSVLPGQHCVQCACDEIKQDAKEYWKHKLEG